MARPKPRVAPVKTIRLVVIDQSPAHDIIDEHREIRLSSHGVRAIKYL
jgi:hypothetical protein